MDAGVAALMGAAIGAAASVIGGALQHKYQAQSAIAEMATRIGLAEFESDMERAKLLTRGARVAPPAAYVSYNAAVLRAIAENNLTPERLAAIKAEQGALFGPP